MNLDSVVDEVKSRLWSWIVHIDSAIGMSNFDDWLAWPRVLNDQ